MPMKKSGLFRNKNAKATPYKNKGVTEVGKEAKTQSYKEYVQKMFGGGMTEPAMKMSQIQLPRGEGGGGMSGKQRMEFLPTIKILQCKINRNRNPVLPRGKKGRGDI
jgi:hypothetical protein